MLKSDKEQIIDEIIKIGQKVHDLLTDENQDDVYALVEDLQHLEDKVFNL